MLKDKEEELKNIYLSEVDQTAIEMENVWGPGVLEKLVSEETKKKFSKHNFLNFFDS